MVIHFSIDTNKVGTNGNTPLNIACKKGHKDIFRLLFSHDKDIVRLLLSHGSGISINRGDDGGDTPLWRR